MRNMTSTEHVMTDEKHFGAAAGRRYLVEEVLNQLRDADVVIMSVDEQHLLQVFKLGDGVVAVPHGLTPLLTHDA